MAYKILNKFIITAKFEHINNSGNVKALYDIFFNSVKLKKYIDTQLKFKIILTY